MNEFTLEQSKERKTEKIIQELERYIEKPLYIMGTPNQIVLPRHVVDNALFEFKKQGQELSELKDPIKYTIIALENGSIRSNKSPIEMKLAQELSELKEKYFEEIVKRLYSDMEYMTYKVMEKQPKVSEKVKQESDYEHELLENFEYVYQTTGMLGDNYLGTIYRKFKDEEKWLVVSYEC